MRRRRQLPQPPRSWRWRPRRMSGRLINYNWSRVRKTLVTIVEFPSVGVTWLMLLTFILHHNRTLSFLLYLAPLSLRLIAARVSTRNPILFQKSPDFAVRGRLIRIGTIFPSCCVVLRILYLLSLIRSFCLAQGIDPCLNAVIVLRVWPPRPTARLLGCLPACLAGTCRDVQALVERRAQKGESIWVGARVIASAHLVNYLEENRTRCPPDREHVDDDARIIPFD